MGGTKGTAVVGLRQVVKYEPWNWGLLEGAKGVQLAEKGLESWQKRAWVQIPDLR